MTSRNSFRFITNLKSFKRLENCYMHQISARDIFILPLVMVKWKCFNKIAISWQNRRNCKLLGVPFPFATNIVIKNRQTVQTSTSNADTVHWSGFIRVPSMKLLFQTNYFPTLIIFARITFKSPFSYVSHRSDTSQHCSKGESFFAKNLTADDLPSTNSARNRWLRFRSTSTFSPLSMYQIRLFLL